MKKKACAASSAMFIRSVTVALALVIGGCGQNADAVSAAASRSASAGDDPHASPDGSFVVKLRSVRSENGEVSAIEVRSVIDGVLEPDSGPFSIAAPVVYANVYGVADRVEDLAVSDSGGAVPLTVEEDEPVPGGFPYFRHWRAERAVEFPVTISYRSLVQPTGGPPGPAFGIRPSAGGVSGAGAGFLVIPENVSSARSHVGWDLSAFGDNASAITTFGEGAFELEGPPAALMQGWYMAGPLERYPENGHRNGFSASWLGEFPFDEHAEMAFVGEAYAYLGDFFGYLDPPPRYRVFMRLMTTPPYGGGTALGNSFMLSRGPAEPEEIGKPGPRSTFFHEMIHQWVGGIEAPYGVNSWFSEGLTTYYTHVLPMRGGFISVEEFGENINELAKSYYSNPARAMTAQEITKIGFAPNSNDIRHIPYQRGALYFADLDTKIRAASGGKRTLDQFMRDIFERREHDPSFVFNHDKWIELVTSELGPEAKKQFETVILGGAVIVPAANAFGSCFEQQKVAYTTDGEVLDGVEWVRDPTVPDDECVKR